MALVTLIKNESVSVPKLADAFGLHHKTVYSYLSSYESDGLEGIRPFGHYPGKVSNKLVELIQDEQRKNPQMTLTVLNRKLYKVYNLRLSERTIRKLVETQTINPLAKELKEPDSQIGVDELLVEQLRDDIDSASPEENQNTKYTRYAGYLIFSTMIKELFSGIYEYIDNEIPLSSKTWEAKKLITSFVLYFIMGQTNIEQTKSVNRQELGCLLGEEASASSKTLKRNMHDLMQMNLPQVVPDLLTQEYISRGYAQIGQLYFDGHFVPYYGKEDIGNGFFTQRRLAVPGHEQYWANDLRGRPVFFLNSYGFSRFTEAILDLSDKAINYMRNAGNTKPLLIAFDRGGYSKALFSQLTRMGVCWVSSMH